MVNSTPSVRLYIGAVSLIGVLVFFICLFEMPFGRVNAGELLLFSALIFIAEMVPTRIPGTDLTMTMTMPLAVNLFLVGGLESTIVCGTIPMLIACIWTERHEIDRSIFSLALFNASNFIISVAIASMVYYIIGGEIVFEFGNNISIRKMIFPLAIWVLVYNLMNVLLIIIASSIYNPQEWKISLWSTFGYNIPNLVISIPFCILFVALYLYAGWLGILLLILPLLVGRHAANLYAKSIAAYLDTITTLGSFMQHYHPYTKGHQERVADLAYAIAKEMHMPVQTLILIRYAGLLHDIGKVGVDYELLDKPGRLSDEEWDIVRNHPCRSAEIVAGMNYLDKIVPWIRYHHERYDGAGYPDGIDGDEIPIEAAILTVADAFDAMTGGPNGEDARSYRAPLSKTGALIELRLGMGRQFHPKVVAAFVRMMTRSREDPDV